MIRSVGVVLGAALVLAGCANPRSEAAARAGTELVGMPKEMLYSCAGVPDRAQQVGDRERLTYVRGSTYTHVETDYDDIVHRRTPFVPPSDDRPSAELPVRGHLHPA